MKYILSSIFSDSPFHGTNCGNSYGQCKGNDNSDWSRAPHRNQNMKLEL